MTGIVDPLGGTIFVGYDANGNVLTVTDARGSTTTHTYDTMNRLETRTDPLSRTEHYAYDSSGNLQTVTDRKNQVTIHTYDGNNRRTRTDYAHGSSLTNAHDPVGNLLTATDSLTGPITRSYDPLNRLVGEVTPQGAIAYAYDVANRRTSMQGNGLSPVAYGYDAASRLTGIAQGPQTASLSYDAANRRSTLTLPNGVTVEYVYDLDSRLSAQIYRNAAGMLGDLQYTYDATGSRIATGGSWARTEIPQPVSPTSYDAANQQLAFGPVTQTFDANGNLLTQTDSSGTTTYTWDARNRLTGINGPSLTTSFAYDALGRRISKIINGQTTTFHYDGVHIVREVGASGDASYLRTHAIDEALTRTDATGTVTYLADALGSTAALTEPDATLSTGYTYEPFGFTHASGQPSPNAFQFTGRENDGTGLYYYRLRYYDTLKGRFIQPDPIGFRAEDTNGFRYVRDNPINLTDPLGLKARHPRCKQIEETIEFLRTLLNRCARGEINREIRRLIEEGERLGCWDGDSDGNGQRKPAPFPKPQESEEPPDEQKKAARVPGAGNPDTTAQPCWICLFPWAIPGGGGGGAGDPLTNRPLPAHSPY